MSVSDPLPEHHPTGFKDNVVRCLRKYVDANGRARRREYWWFALFQILVLAVPFGIALAIGVALESDDNPALATGLGLVMILVGLVYLGLVIPSITVLIRRFHDVGLTGWLVLLSLLPFGGLFSLIVCLVPSQPRPNKHGPVPARPADYARTFS